MDRKMFHTSQIASMYVSPTVDRLSIAPVDRRKPSARGKGSYLISKDTISPWWASVVDGGAGVQGCGTIGV